MDETGVRADKGRRAVPEKHKVVQGEHFAAIARANGHADFRPLWDAGENSSIKSLRKTPHILLPGDEVFARALEPKDESAPTETKTKFKAGGVKLKLRLEFRSIANDKAIKSPVSLTVEGDHREEALDNDGRVERIIPPAALAGRVVVRDPKLPLDLEANLEIGGLHPLDTVTGQIGRLNNLGYEAGPILEPATPEAKLKFRSAVEEFQCENGLTVDGVVGGGTKDKLKSVHGC